MQPSVTAPDVLIVLPDLRGRGAERAAVLAVRGLVDIGVSVEVAVSRDAGPLREQIPEGVPVHLLSPRGMLASLIPLVSLLRVRRPTSVISHLTHANIVVAAAVVLARFRGRLLVVEHTVYSRKHHGLYGRLMAAGARLAYRRADSVVAVSAPVAQDIETSFSLPSTKVVVVPNPIDLSSVMELARAPFSPPWAPFFVAVGSLEPEKGYDLLIEAFAELRGDPPLALVIVGEGSTRDRLLALARDRGCGDSVHLAGYDPNPYRWIRGACALVISSHYEGLPTVALEAFALGVPVVALDAGYGLAHVLAPFDDAVIVTDPGAHALAEAMRRFMPRPGGPASRETVSRALAVPAALKGYDIGAVARRLAELALPD